MLGHVSYPSVLLALLAAGLFAVSVNLQQHVTQLCRRLRAPQPTVSHHLGLLRVHGLVRARRAGKLVYYSVEPVRYNRACAAVAELLSPVTKSARKKKR